MEDNELIKQCKNGEKLAFETLITKYHPLVFKYLCKISEDEFLAEDLVQETFIKMIRGIDKFEIYGKAKFYTYLISIAKNCYIDHYRREKKRYMDISIHDNLTLIDQNDVEEMVITNLEHMQAIEAIDNLTDSQNLAIKLKYIEDLTTKEISEILNIEVKTVKSRIHNGMVKLRNALKGGEMDERN